jgi:hypothetical protein
MSVGRTGIRFVCWIALTTWADRTFDAWPPVYSRINMSHTLHRDATGGAPCWLFYSFGRAIARIGINRSSSGISSIILARARYLASNSRHRLTKRPADKRGK